MIHLTTLGGVCVFRDDTGEPLLAGQQPKRIALLGYLAVSHPRRAQRRDSLLALLWPELNQERARAALRQALHGIRKSLGADAIASDGTEAIDLNPRIVRCDLWDLEKASADGDPERVLQLYKGDLLDGLFISGAPEFEQWLDRERRRVRDLVRDAAWAVADDGVRTSHATTVVRGARLAASLSEYDENAIRRAMQLLATVGERATALSMYAKFASELRRELDTEPSLETRALAADLRCTRAEEPSVAPRSEPVHVGGKRVSSPPDVSHSVRPLIRRRYIAAACASLIALVAATRLARPASSALDPRRVRVESFTNESGRSALDTLARALQQVVRGALVRLDNVEVISDSAPQSTLVDRAGTVVRGAVRVVADSMQISAEVVDRASGAIVRAITTRASLAEARGGARGTVDRFSDRVSAAVATALYPGWGKALSQPPSYAGYRRFLDGMRRVKLEQHDAAVTAFREAFREDSSFTTAGLLSATEYYQMKQFAAADSIVSAIGGRRALLPEVDGHLYDWLVRSLRGDRIGARSAMGEIVRLIPSAELAWLQLAIDNVETARPREALDALDHIDLSAEFTEGWASYWATRAEALHLLGDHSRELAVTREGLKRHPELRVLVNYELRALAALGRLNELEAGLRLVTDSATGGGVDAPTTMRQVALELAAHGNAAASTAMFRRARAWYASRPASERGTPAYRLGYARTLYLSDDRAGARAIYDSVLRAHPVCLDCVGALSVLAARSGDRTAADSGVALLTAASRPYLFGRNLMWMARIAAASGDRETAAARLSAAFAAGAELDVMTHADVDLRLIKPESVYHVFARN